VFTRLINGFGASEKVL